MASKITAVLELEGKDALKTLAALEKGVADLGKTGTKSIGSMNSSLDVLKGTLGAQAILRGIDLVGRGFRAGAENALDFGKAVAEINSIVPRTAQETLTLKQELLGLSNQFGDKAQNQARAFYNILSAGITDTSKALNVLQVSNQAAVAGLVDVDTAAKGLISVVNSYGEETINASQASDILFTAVREGRTTFGELAFTIGRVASIASSAKVNFSEVAGALAFVTKSGIQTDEAVIGLRGLFTSVIGPTDDVKKKAKELGIEFSATALETKGLGGFLNDLRTATGGNVETLRELFPNVRAFNIAVKVAGGDVEDFNRILGETANAGGATTKALAVITDSAGFQFDKLTNQLSNFPTAILTNFEEPLADALKAVNNFVGNGALLLIPETVDFIVESFQGLLNLRDDTEDFFDSLGELAAKAVNAISGVDEVTTESLQEDLGKLEEQLKAVESTSASTQAALSGTTSAEAQANLDKQAEAIRTQIDLKKNQIDFFQQADQADAKIVSDELKRREDRNRKIEEFQNKVKASREAFLAEEEQRAEEQAQKDVQRATDVANEIAGKEQEKFDAIALIRATQKENEAIAKEEEDLAKELEDEEGFQKIADALGKEAALREFYRIKQIDDKTKQVQALQKLQEKADKKALQDAEKAAKAQEAVDRQSAQLKVSILSNTANLAGEILGKENKAAFLLSKASALAGVAVNTGLALSAIPAQTAPIPYPGNLAAAANLATLVKTNAAIQTATILASTIKGFQGGGFTDTAFSGIVNSPSRTGDQNLIGVNGDEVVFNRRQQETLFNLINQGVSGSGGNNITINNPMFMNEEMVDEVIDQINDRVEFRNKRLLASEVA